MDSTRQSQICDKNIILTKEDPIERLKEFCQQGIYTYRFVYDKFLNGIMTEMEICYRFGTKKGVQKKTLIKEARFVQTKDVTYAQKVISAIILDKLGLGVEVEDGEDNADMIDINNLTSSMSKIFGSVVENSEILSDAKSRDFLENVSDKLLGKKWSDIVADTNGC
jgi:hypothetical protein